MYKYYMYSPKKANCCSALAVGRLLGFRSSSAVSTSSAGSVGSASKHLQDGPHGKALS
eukprot:SAG22_NODE_1308_length_4787_cov_3.561860_4_plen_58_part_00